MNVMQMDSAQSWRNAQRVEFIKGFYQTGRLLDGLFDLFDRTQHLSHGRVNRLLEKNLRTLKDVSHVLYRVADEEGVDRRFQRYFDKLLGELWHELGKLRDNARLIESYSEGEAEITSRHVRGLKQIDRQIIAEARRDLPRQVRRARRFYGKLVPLFESILPQYHDNFVILRTLFVMRHFFNELIEIAGGENIFGDVDDDTLQPSLEEVLERQPDVIIELLPSNRGDPPEIAERLTDWQKLATIPAVRNRRVHILAGDYLLLIGPRLHLAARRFAEAIQDVTNE